MAGQFQIEYAQGAPDVVRQPRANMNVDTGAGAIGNAVANFGGALQKIGEKYQEADDALELLLAELRCTMSTKRLNTVLDKIYDWGDTGARLFLCHFAEAA